MSGSVRGWFSNMPSLSNVVADVAAVLFGNPVARRILETPGWEATQTPPKAPFLDIESDEVSLPGCPVDTIPTADGKFLFVSLQVDGGTQDTPGSIAILDRRSGQLEFNHLIPLPAAPWGLELVGNGAGLAIANSHGVALVDVADAVGGSGTVVPRIAHYGRNLYTNRVLESPDGRTLFASDEHNRTISLINLERLRSGRSASSCLVSQVPVDHVPVGLELSDDGRFLYTTCEMRRLRAPDFVNWLVWSATLRGRLRRAGTVCTIDLDLAQVSPANAVISRNNAGGHPVRIKRSRDGQLAWVTARASNQLLALSLEDPSNPRIVATIPAGPAPAGVAVMDELGSILVANTDRFALDSASASLAVFAESHESRGICSLVGAIEVGRFPREVRIDKSHNCVYVANFGSQSLSVISIDSIASAIDTAKGRPQ